ncbi:hypothetical protein VFPPC_16475 [Pochonia chlamydosporia 170]|uniref:Uncharacterized protein n=1 Tax=Pochonia chlamydosporia 170 TaxID=1380566 RepID=A0A179FDP4_METCM|nr:hypothetical protein VFPPC_16475 [Pochonia chlamydosporia 170]OAQ63430.1 hypothetical protein VFPPC_16475 [Pochonia chlamydosporia 170]
MSLWEKVRDKTAVEAWAWAVSANSVVDSGLARRQRRLLSRMRRRQRRLRWDLPEIPGVAWMVVDGCENGRM